jgi:alpha-tubulin suppressor-like RCC1 family protein
MPAQSPWPLPRIRRLLAPGAVAAALAIGAAGLAATPASAAHHPVPTAGLTGVTAVSSGNGFFLALLKTGQVDAFGVNNLGQLGNGTTTNSTTPVRVKGLANVTAISAGGFSSLALLSNGTVMAWGSDRFGQLGNGTSGTISTVPVPVHNLSGVTAISAGRNHNLALLASGTAMAWGTNNQGQLGTGTVAPLSDVPVPVSGLSSIAAVSAGNQFSLALLKDGTVRSWGTNSNAQLGIGNINPAFTGTPQTVRRLHGVTAISAGGFHSLALLANGTAMAWGDDEAGELGNGVNPPFSTVPVKVLRLATATAVAASDALDPNASFSVALLRGGTVDDWGATAAANEVPRPLAGATGVAAISPGLLLLANGTVKEFTP